MSADILKNARAKLAQAAAEVARWEQFIEMAEALESEPAAAQATVRVRTRPDPAPRTPAPSALPDEINPSSTKEVLDKAAEILSERGSAMRASDIYARIVEAGLRVSGKKPKANLTAKFAMRRDLFRYSEATGMWSLTAWAEAAASPPPPSGGPPNGWRPSVVAQAPPDEEAVG